MSSSKIVIILQKFTLNANERLKSSKLIEQLFKKGKSFSEFPLRVIYLQSEKNIHHLQAAFSVSSKNFKKAVERNRIKRLMKEAYRLQKLPLKNELERQQKFLSVFIIYTGNKLPEYKIIYEKMGVALSRLEKVISQA